MKRWKNLDNIERQPDLDMKIIFDHGTRVTVSKLIDPKC